jgi:putative oxidoreductase
MKHGTPKLFHFQEELMWENVGYPNLFHLGSVGTLLVAAFADGICSFLAVIGLATRWAVAFICCSLAVGWGMVHGFAFTGLEGRIAETISLYMIACIAIFLIGPGKYSVDALIVASAERKRLASEQASPVRA